MCPNYAAQCLIPEPGATAVTKNSVEAILADRTSKNRHIQITLNVHMSSITIIKKTTNSTPAGLLIRETNSFGGRVKDLVITATKR